MHSFRRVVLLCVCIVLCGGVACSQTPQLQMPSAIAYDAAGNLYIADTNRNQVLEATVGGALIVIAGTGTQGFLGDNGPAITTELNAPQGIAVGSDDTLYIADTGNHRIRAITAGQIATVAGTGIAGFNGDGSNARSATLRSPTALALDPAGALLVCDTGNHRIRRIANGIVTTVAGNGKQGFSGDGGPATAAELDTPLGIAAFAAGAFYIADAHNDRIRTVGLDGIIHTVAGTGVRGFSGDGGPAVQAKLALPGSLLVTSAGTVFSDTNNQRLRLIDSNGTLRTIAGSGTEGKAADGDATLSSTIDTPKGTALSPFGWVTFADTANRMLRVVSNGQLFLPAALASARTSQIVATLASAEVYGAATLSLHLSGSVGVPQGTVQLLDAGTLLTANALSNGSASLSLPLLSGGQHSLTAAYLGDGLNPAASLTTTLTITPAASITSEPPFAQNSYAGLPVTLSAQVATTTLGQPTGAVQFLEGTNVVATGQLSAGNATAVYLSPGAGSHSIQAVYSGDGNFQPSNSAAVSLTVQTMPDFVLTAAASSQTVQGGSIATYPITVAAQPGPFSGAVSMSASGLPAGATVSFSPAQIVPGVGSGIVQMSITTPVSVVELIPAWGGGPSARAAFLLFAASLFAMRRRQKGARLILICCLSLFLMTTLGCGNRTVAAPATTPTAYSITVIGSSTNLAAAVVIHTTSVQLTVR